MKQTKKIRRPAKVPTKQTGDDVVEIASRLMRVFRGVSDVQLDASLSMGGERFTFRALLSLAGSCLAQDETKGKRTSYDANGFVGQIAERHGVELKPSKRRGVAVKVPKGQKPYRIKRVGKAARS